ncbi:MAG: ATPase domain-containing protein, partial [Candidatus Diapherotrites archaeon]
MKEEKNKNQRIQFERVKTGVPGLDDMMGGGIPKGNLVVLSGDPGSGKTVLCWQYIYYGATQYNEKSVYVSLEESEQTIFEGALEFGWDLRKLV